MQGEGRPILQVRKRAQRGAQYLLMVLSGGSGDAKLETQETGCTAQGPGPVHQWYLRSLAFGGMEISLIEKENPRKRRSLGQKEFPVGYVGFEVF